MPLRGTSISQRIGQKAILMNAEIRLPFFNVLFPSNSIFWTNQWCVFVDVGVAWDDEYPEFWKEDSWEIDNNIGWNMTYGFGPRFIFFGMPWQLDYAWQYNPHLGTISSRSWYLSIGLDF